MNITPAVGDKYEHPSGTYAVEWVCDETSIGLSCESMTWTGSVAEMEDAGFSESGER